MIRNEGIAMADEQNQGNTIINQGTTIDNLPGLDGMTPTQKQAFIDSAFVPIRGTISGEMSTRKVTGSDLAASGENKIDSISVAGTTIEPVNKNVNIPLATTVAAGAMSSTDKSKLDNLVNIKSIGTMLDMNENGTLRVSFSGATGPLYVDISDGTGGYDLAYDDTLTTTYHQGEEKPNRLSVAVPVPDPLDERLPADNGSMLTYDEDDGVIWTSPAEFWRDNIDYDTHDVNDDGKLTLNWNIIDGSGGLRLYNGSITTVGVDLRDDGGINLASDGELYVQTDNTLIRHEKVGYGDTYLSVAVPVPDPEEHNAEEGDVLTFDGTDVVWDAPAFTPPTADNYDNNKVLTVTVDNQGNPSYHWDRRVQYVYPGLGLCETSSSAADVQATLAIDTYNAHDGDVMCYDSSKDPEVFWSDRITLLEARVAALEEALGGNSFTVNGNNPTINGDTPTVG
jgi:hypothetical protein